VKSLQRNSPGRGQRTAPPGPNETTVRVGTILAIPEILRKLGADPADVLTRAGLRLDLFDDPESRISNVARGRLLSHCVASTGCLHFGLLVGQQAGLHSFGLVGLLAKYSPDAGTALRSLVRFFHLHNRGAAVELAVDGDRAAFSYGVWQLNVEAADQLGDGAVAVMLNIMRGLCGPDWAPVEARFAHRRPEDVEPYRRLFSAPLFFDAERYGLVFATRWLSRPLPDVDHELLRLLQQQIDALEARHGEDFPAQVRSVLRSALLTDAAGADSVAALFSMHSRTLNRRLNAFGTSFRDLVDEVRFEIARQMLESSSMDVTQIADMLDYADASAFTRAFRRWSGTTPARWRTERGSWPRGRR
jgi:AraC-like DNA-binding protein